MSTNGHNRSPFRDDLAPSGFDSRAQIDVFANNPDVVVRKIDWLEGSPALQAQKLSHYKKLVSDLSVFGIHNSMLMPLMAEENGAQVAYILSERIEGQDLLTEAQAKPDVATQALRSITSYYQGIIDNGGEYVDELRLEQLVDKDGVVFLRDLDPSEGTYNADEPSIEDRDNMYSNLELLQLEAGHLADQQTIETLEKLKQQISPVSA